MAVPNQRDFATEVRSDRLDTLWRLTLISVLLVGAVVLFDAWFDSRSPVVPLIPFAIVIAGCLATRWLLRDPERYLGAAHVYAWSCILALGTGLFFSDPQFADILPFGFLPIIFLIGLLLPPRYIWAATLLSAGLSIGVPYAALGNWAFAGPHQIAALLLMAITAFLSSQITGELYQIAEWALNNYRRERRITDELVENRQLLERSLARSEALSERLQETNEALTVAKAAADTANRQRGQFLANMSHELRTPLNAIIGFSETMLKFPQMYDDVKLPETYRSDLQQIYDSGRQLLTVINDILDLSKIDVGKLEVRMTGIDLKPIADSVRATANGLIGEKPLHLASQIDDDLPLVWADEHRIRQVLLNLYSNAAKFTDAGVITLTIRARADHVHISLRDTGVGITPEKLDTIFEEFAQVENEGRDPRAGAGLGLTISRQLIQLMGGRIWAESIVGVGSTFHITLSTYQAHIKTDSSAPVVPQIAPPERAAL
ncbi:MAG: hypothetical protein GYB67_15410 [Chloroflexi bacterium]|nr:hypothetical protein [Chloroflexota bacterium]